MDDRQVWENFLAWMRFVVFDGDLSELYEHVKENQAENVKKQIETGGDEEDWAAQYVQVSP